MEREIDIGEPLAAALSEYALIVSGREPDVDEMNEIYWAAVEVVEKVMGCLPT